MDRRQQVVEAAFDLVATRGLEGFRLREVAASVGIDHSKLHHYFATKQHLVEAVVDHATGQFWRGQQPEPSLTGHLKTLGELIEHRPALFVVLRELDLLAHRDDAVRAAVETAEAGWRRSLRERLDRPDDDLVELVIAAVRGISLRPELATATLGRLEEMIQRCAS